MGTDWKKMDSAPRDGTPIWVIGKEPKLTLVRWMTAHEAAFNDGGREEDYIGDWATVPNGDDVGPPRFWIPGNSIQVPSP